MQKIAIFFVLLILIPDAYIYFGYLKKRVSNKLLRFLHWLPSILMIALFVKLMYLSGPNPLADGSDAFAWLGVIILLIGAAKTLFMLGGWIGDLLHKLWRKIPHRPFTIAAILLGLGTFCFALYGSVWGVARLETKELTLSFSDLPEAFDGYKILQVSDIHVGSYNSRPGIVQHLVQRINGLHPDAIMFTGDLVNQRSEELRAFVPELGKLQAKDGVFSILGNHDYGGYYTWKDSLEEKANMDTLYSLQAKMGWILLRNEHRIIRRGADSLAVIGVENDSEPPFPDLGDLPRAMQGTENMFQILMTHDPTHWDREVLPDSKIQLTLSGHTHGGQVKLLGWSPTSMKYKESDGLYTQGERVLYVSVGIGYVGLPFRFGAWPEVVLITLKKKQ